MGIASPMEQPGTASESRLRAAVSSLPLSRIGPFLALLLACAYFTYKTDRFLTGTNLSLVVQQSLVVGVLAIGQTLVILTAGIDLSCGAVMALGAIVMTREAVTNGVDPYLAILLGLATCAAFGAANGILISVFR